MMACTSWTMCLFWRKRKFNSSSLPCLLNRTVSLRAPSSCHLPQSEFIRKISSKCSKASRLLIDISIHASFSSIKFESGISLPTSQLPPSSPCTTNLIQSAIPISLYHNLRLALLSYHVPTSSRLNAMYRTRVPRLSQVSSFSLSLSIAITIGIKSSLILSSLVRLLRMYQEASACFIVLPL